MPRPPGGSSGGASLPHGAPARVCAPCRPALPRPRHTQAGRSAPRTRARVRHGARGRGRPGWGSRDDTHQCCYSNLDRATQSASQAPQAPLGTVLRVSRREARPPPATHAPLPLRPPRTSPPPRPRRPRGQASGTALPAAQPPACQPGPLPRRRQPRSTRTVPESRGRRRGLQAPRSHAPPRAPRLLAGCGGGLWGHQHSSPKRGAAAPCAWAQQPPQTARPPRGAPPPDRHHVLPQPAEEGRWGRGDWPGPDVCCFHGRNFSNLTS